MKASHGAWVLADRGGADKGPPRSASQEELERLNVWGSQVTRKKVCVPEQRSRKGQVLV